jgi:uncharacterized protein YndB with AHSA1/START domain
MTATHAEVDVKIVQEIQINAPVERTFAALLEEMGPANQTPDGKALRMVLEAFPGGRWYRDLGDENGHFWGHVQAIKRPSLLEITGPLFVSAPVLNNLQYRLTERDGGTLLTFRHTGYGPFPPDFADQVSQGWTPLHDRVRRRAEENPQAV